MKQTDAFPIPHRNRRTTFSLPTETLDRIERLSRRMGVSQSAFVAELLAEPIAAMAAIMDVLPSAGATPQDIRRAKGSSVELIRNVVGEAQALLHSVLTDQQPRKPSFTATAPAQPRSRRAARGRTEHSQPSTHSQPARQGESRRASATAEDSGSARNAARRPARGARASGRTAPPSRPRKTSGRLVKRGTKR